MGASSSTEQVSDEQREAESLAASTGALPMLQKAFSALADPQTKTVPIHSLQPCVSLICENPTCGATSIPPGFQGLLNSLGPSIVDLFFLAEKGGVSWVNFLRGYVKCCRRMSASTSFNMLFRVFAIATAKAGLPVNLQFESEDVDSKMSGFLKPSDILMLLLLCFIMSYKSRNLEFSGGGNNGLPNLSHLVLSAVLSCAEVSSDMHPWDCEILTLDVQLPAGKILTWALKTVPGLPDCLAQFVNGKFQKSVLSEEPQSLEASSTTPDLSTIIESNAYLLTQERAWAISLTLTSNLREEILKTCYSDHGDGTNNLLLYRSSIHGKGMSRFWSNVEGYNGPTLILISASLCKNDESGRRWILGALTHQAFENKDIFYGSSGSLYAISPVFDVFSSSGKEKNFVYSHLHPAASVYDPHPKPVGIAFGGSPGNERIFLDEDFTKLTVRHHAVDKTYQNGPLLPNQGFLPCEAEVFQIEVWGLAGEGAKKKQALFQNREQLFANQRRKVDLNQFGSWEDSPERMMMDMVTDPNRPQREER